MKTSILTEIARIEESLRQMANIANDMPDDMPNAWLLSPQHPPSMHFTDPSQAHVLPIVEYFGREGWMRRDMYGRAEYIKTLPCGVQIVIENAERRSLVPEPISLEGLN